MSANSLKTITLSAIFGAAAMVVAGSAAYAADAGSSMDKPAGEKCYGVAKAGKNDCAAAGHSCAGQSTKDMDKASWVSLPAGVCEKLSGGSTTKM
ncbi:MAG: BufA1 family periplasmic bufferin-type metallophore [Steroidobacteraceae bacterium]